VNCECTEIRRRNEVTMKRRNDVKKESAGENEWMPSPGLSVPKRLKRKG
jgi:hypothetical protein